MDARRNIKIFVFMHFGYAFVAAIADYGLICWSSPMIKNEVHVGNTYLPILSSTTSSSKSMSYCRLFSNVCCSPPSYPIQCGRRMYFRMNVCYLWAGLNDGLAETVDNRWMELAKIHMVSGASCKLVSPGWPIFWCEFSQFPWLSISVHGTIMYLNLTFMNWSCMTGILVQ